MSAEDRRTQEIAHEVLKPLGIDLADLKDTSRRDFEAQLRDIVRRDQDGELYNRQKGWSKGE